MDEQLKMEVAKFRFGVISEFVTGVRFARGERARILKEKTDKQWHIPGSTRTRISVGTIQLWISKYRASGEKLESLMPLERRDKGEHRALDLEVRLALSELRREKPDATLNVLTKLLREKNVLGPEELLHPATTYRFLKSLPESKDKPVDRRMFEAEHPNALWQCDVCHGPKVMTESGVRRKAYLFAILDDHSRLITHARFYLNENKSSLKQSLQDAVARRGKPQKFFVDNGACYRSQSLENICARLGIVLVHSKPYTPQGKGKIERWFRTTRQSFFELLGDKELSLEKLNEDLDSWVEDYNTRMHSSLRDSPIHIYQKGLQCVRPAPPNLKDFFRESETRTVRHDRCVQLHGVFYEVPVDLVGRKVELQWNEDEAGGVQDVEVFFESNSYGKVRPVESHLNARLGRESATRSSVERAAPEDEQKAHLADEPLKSGELFKEVQS
jgi:transposase InsO family protein